MSEGNKSTNNDSTANRSRLFKNSLVVIIIRETRQWTSPLLQDHPKVLVPLNQDIHRGQILATLPVPSLTHKTSHLKKVLIPDILTKAGRTHILRCKANQAITRYLDIIMRHNLYSNPNIQKDINTLSHLEEVLIVTMDDQAWEKYMTTYNNTHQTFTRHLFRILRDDYNSIRLPTRHILQVGITCKYSKPDIQRHFLGKVSLVDLIALSIHLLIGLLRHPIRV
jgi:hypothetical protein